MSINRYIKTDRINTKNSLEMNGEFKIYYTGPGLKNYIKVTLLYSFSDQLTLLLLILSKINNKRSNKTKSKILFYCKLLIQ
jgi:hypothetical protein